MLSGWNTNNVALSIFMLPFGADDGYPTVPLLAAIHILVPHALLQRGCPGAEASFSLEGIDCPLETILRSRMPSLRRSVRDSDQCQPGARASVRKLFVMVYSEAPTETLYWTYGSYYA